MKFIPAEFPGVLLIEFPTSGDVRGSFAKTFHQEIFKRNGISMQLAEEYYSISHKNVVRGMHLQSPPFALDKLVYCPAGAVLDVLVDLRRTSPTYRQAAAFELSAKNHRGLFIPSGIAHGFLSLEPDSLMHYKCSSVYSPQNDTGVHWASFGFPWPVASPIISGRDDSLPSLTEFVSPFV